MRIFAPGSWNGPPKIILGIDIGATQSAVAFTYLSPGAAQTLCRVQEWPGQPNHKGQSRIPTVVSYNKESKPVCFGAEAIESLEEGCTLVRNFKLHLHPPELRDQYDIKLEALPEGLTLNQVYTDFMAYLFAHTKKYFWEHVLNGGKIWQACYEDMTIVLAHPNGWGVVEQGFLRQAAIAANLVNKENACSNLQFVSEAEASVHYCIFHSNLHHGMNKDIRFVVCDAGGSTIDTTAYRVVNESPLLELAETKASSCVQNGGVCVDIEFQKYLSSVLSKIDAPQEFVQDYMLAGMRDFEENVKKEFDGTNATHRINLGAGRKSYEEMGIRLGRLNLPGHTMRAFFDRSVETAVRSIREQMEAGCQHILLVGGFGESLYLRREVMSRFEGKDCSVTVTNDPNAKAVADGSVIWGAKRSVIARATRKAYGIQVLTPYDQNNVEHRGRKTIVECDGVKKVVGCWSQIVDKDTVVDAKDAIREEYQRLYESPNAKLGQFTVKVFSYNGVDGNTNTWLTDQNGHIAPGFQEVCQIEADLGGMRKALKNNEHKQRRNWFQSKKYFHLDFKVAIQFGDTELRAFLEWEKKGATFISPAVIIPREPGFIVSSGFRASDNLNNI
ncbi:heat shock 70 kDa protein 12A [Rhizoctonia solani 123E]|uniref:Heat shock 70 kDa protein 12A n=1 Tax=Rhizoctonia solani 123E TaxID=1423351 RepID=A0A074RVD4_9AGAM|nr:heat shock 70 kDa protein 12A [Rhizoctonia solani 123E]